MNSNGRWDRSEVGENFWLNLVSSLDTEKLSLDGTSGWGETSAENTTGTSVNLILVLGEVDDSGDVRWHRWLKEDLDGRADLWDVVGGEREFGYNAEVGSTSLHGPEEVWIGGSGGGDDLASGKDHLVGHNVVHGETILGGEVRDTSSNGETRRTNGLKTSSDDNLSRWLEELVHGVPVVSGADLNGVAGAELEGLKLGSSKQDTAISVGSSFDLRFIVSHIL